MARCRSIQECFLGMREALGDTEPYNSSLQCKELHRCCCQGPLVPLTMGDSGTSTVLAQYESMEFLSLRQNEKTTVRDPVQHKR